MPDIPYPIVSKKKLTFSRKVSGGQLKYIPKDKEICLNKAINLKTVLNMSWIFQLVFLKLPSSENFFFRICFKLWFKTTNCIFLSFLWYRKVRCKRWYCPYCALHVGKRLARRRCNRWWRIPEQWIWFIHGHFVGIEAKTKIFGEQNLALL